MSLNEKRLNRGALLSILILTVLLAYFVVFAIINFPGFAYHCTTDMYEDTLVARLMWEQKTLFPKNFLFGNQYYVLATPVLAAFFYGLCGSMNMAMGLATTVMSLLILISLYWMLKPFVKQPYMRLAVLLTLVAGVYGPQTVTREDGQLFFVMCSFYACYLISFFVLMGDYARARESEALRPLAFSLALLLSFCMGMQSLRQTCVSVLPILFIEFITLAVKLTKHEKPNFKSMSFIRAASYFAANVAGIVFIKLLNVKRNEIFYGQSIFSGASVSDKLKDMVEALTTVSGLEFTRGDSRLFFTVLFIFFSLIVVAALFTLLRRKDFSSTLAIFWWLCIISVLAVIAASFVTSVRLRAIYIFPLYTLPALSLAVLSVKLKPGIQNILCLVLCVLSSMNIYYSYQSQIDASLNDSTWPAKEVADYAIENGYELVYGSHSHTAPLVAAASDGQLIAGCWDDEVIFKVSPHINIKDAYYLADYERALFVFLDKEVRLAELECALTGTELQFHKQIGDYYLYTTSNQLMYPISENINEDWLFPEYN